MKKRPIVAYNIESGEYTKHISVLHAANELKINQACILKVLSDEFKQSGGYTFCEECINYEEIIEWKLNQPCKRGQGHQRKVIATDLYGNSETYDSAKIAGEALGYSKSTVSKCCLGKSKNKYFNFKYV